jgi:hypothetical protein
MLRAIVEAKDRGAHEPQQFARAALPAVHELWALFEILDPVCDREQLWIRVYGDVAVAYAPAGDYFGDDIVLATQTIHCTEQQFFGTWESWRSIVAPARGFIAESLRAALVHASRVYDRRNEVIQTVQRSSAAF